MEASRQRLSTHALELPLKVPDMQAQRQSEQRHMDQWEVGSDKAWQVDVGHRTARGSKVLRQSCQRAATPVPQKDETLTSNDSGSNRRPSVLPPLQPCVDEVSHAELDGKVEKRMHSLHTDQCWPSPGWWKWSEDRRWFGKRSLLNQCRPMPFLNRRWCLFSVLHLLFLFL